MLGTLKAFVAAFRRVDGFHDAGMVMQAWTSKGGASIVMAAEFCRPLAAPAEWMEVGPGPLLPQTSPFAEAYIITASSPHLLSILPLVHVPHHVSQSCLSWHRQLSCIACCSL